MPLLTIEMHAYSALLDRFGSGSDSALCNFDSSTSQVRTRPLTVPSNIDAPFHISVLTGAETHYTRYVLYILPSEAAQKLTA